jgi:hypothetical protein
MATKSEPDEMRKDSQIRAGAWGTPKLPGGRRLKFQSPADLQRAIDAYFRQPGKKSIMGLCVHLDCDRQTLLNYQRRDGFSDVIARARDRIQKYYEELGQDPRTHAFADRMMTRMGWRCVEKTELDHGVTDEFAELLREINGSRILPS